MVLGSHNTMTYLKPRKWWMWLGRFMAKCQHLPIEKQYEHGARWFDLRISIPKDKNGNHETPVFSHGLMDFKGTSVDDVLKFLSTKKDAYCRLVLEKGGKKEVDLFKSYAMIWKTNYPTLNITQITQKGQWNTLVEPNAKSPYGGGQDAYASCNGSYPKYQNWPGIFKQKAWSGLLLDDLWPWIYAKLHNKKNIEKHKDQNITLLIDFIGLK